MKYDTATQFVILNGFITPGNAKKRNTEATGEDNGRGHAEYFESLVNKASLQELGGLLVNLALMDHRDHAPYSYYGDGPQTDPLFETATRWGIDVEMIKAAITENPKPRRNRKDRVR